ncbi:MAG: hypothetical protein U1F43_21885 [Myxococcota bacterium]
MKPARPESGRADVRRARLLVTRLLGLVAGFPEGEAWVELVRGAPPVISTLDRTRLARATRWLTSLRGEYRAVLPEVVGDAEAWVRVVAARLDALKPLVHDEVRPSIDATEALRWVLVLEPERLARAQAFAPSLPPRPLVEQVRLALMASDDPEAARCWIAALAIAPVPVEVEIRRSRQALATACGAAKRPQLPTLAPAVAGLAPLLVERSLRELAELGPLLAPLLPTMALAADAWAEVEALHAALSARLGLAELPTAALAARADALAARPIPVDGAELARALRQLVGTPLVATIAEGVAALPEVDRGRFVEHWALLAERRDEAFVAAVVRGLGRHVAAGRSLAPWAKAGRFGHTYNTPESGLPDRPSAAFVDGYYELCAALHDEGLDADTLGALVQVDAPRALARARALAAVEGRASYYGDEAVQLAHALVAATPDDAARFAAVLAAQRLDIAERVQVGALALLDLGVPPAGVAALLVEETGRLEALGATRAMAAHEGRAAGAASPTIAWGSH